MMDDSPMEVKTSMIQVNPRDVAGFPTISTRIQSLGVATHYLAGEEFDPDDEDIRMDVDKIVLTILELLHLPDVSMKVRAVLF